jgi:iron-sulfur cluster assembly protein
MSTETQFPITVTPQALEQVKRLVAKDGRPDVFLRVGVKGGGCSGFEYVLKLDIKRTPFDIEFESDGVRILSDSKSAQFLQGSSLEYTGNLIGGGFKIENPNAARSCGCGSSFTPKPIDGKS